MNQPGNNPSRERLETLYEHESRRVFATLIRLLGDFDLAEEAMHEAFATALVQWEKEGIPEKPRAWLVSTGRFKAIDALRRRSRFDESLQELATRLESERDAANESTTHEVEDDRLRLIFLCCHPAIPNEARIALTLREVCGLTTEEIASAFLTTPPTLAQRIVRAKNKIREEDIPYEIPPLSELPARLDSVLSVIYLVFNEGYSASSGETITRPELSSEAIRLGRLLLELLPDPEVLGLLGLMLLTESRRAARTTAGGDLILLEDQDRALWNRAQIEEGRYLVEQSLASGRFGVYTLQAAISGVHAEASSAADTDWAEIVALYEILLRAAPSPIVELNRAVAIAMRDGPAAGLQLIDQLLDQKELSQYHLAHAARADLCRRLGRTAAAKTAYEQALALARQEPERRFLQKRLRELA